MSLPENIGYSRKHTKGMSDIAMKVGRALGPRKRPSKAVDTSQFSGVSDSVQRHKPQYSSSNVDNVMSAIGQYESGGNYRAVGPKTAKGNQAYGKYQVMDFNIPNWTKQALGKSLTTQQFLNNQAAQDSVARYKMGRLLEQYGNSDDVASVWFSGRPVSKAGNAKDVIGTSVPQYIKNIRAIMAKNAGQQSQPVNNNQTANNPNYIIRTDQEGNKYRYSHLLQKYVKVNQAVLNPYLGYQLRNLQIK